MDYVLGILGVLCLGLAFLLPSSKGANEGQIAFLLGMFLIGGQVIIGLLALFRRPRAESGPARRSWGPLLCGLLCVAMWGISGPAFVELVKSGGNQVPCHSNLKQIGVAINLYADDHGGVYPPSLDVLAVEGDWPLPAKVFVCPYSSDSVAEGASPKEIAAKIAAGGHCSYLYFGAGLTTSAPGDAIVACDRLENHGGDGVSMLFADGHVEWEVGPRQRVQRILDEIRAGHNPPRWEKLYGTEAGPASQR